MTPDAELLRRYAEDRAEAAFAELVERHVSLVYATAWRLVGADAHLAQDVAQIVFTDLARKAQPLSRRAVLTGWLHTSARFAAAKAVRSERRRQTREAEATARHDPTPDPEPTWHELRPLLDEAIGHLAEDDREAVLLRYFEGKGFKEIGATLGLNENAARMRVERSLDKLRAVLVRRGVTTTTAALATTLSENAVQMAPAGLATALAAGAVKGASVTSSTLTLVKGALKIMAWAKAKTAIVVVVGVLVATTTATVAIRS